MSEVSKVPNTVLLIKDQRACWRCQRCETLYCKIIVLYVRGVKSGVCGFYTTLHTEYCCSCWRCQRLYSVYSGLSPLPGGKAISAFRLGGLAVHHWSVRGGSFVKFLGPVNYKGDCRQDAQPIPNSYIN